MRSNSGTCSLLVTTSTRSSGVKSTDLVQVAHDAQVALVPGSYHIRLRSCPPLRWGKMRRVDLAVQVQKFRAVHFVEHIRYGPFLPLIHLSDGIFSS